MLYFSQPAADGDMVRQTVVVVRPVPFEAGLWKWNRIFQTKALYGVFVIGLK